MTLLAECEPAPQPKVLAGGGRTPQHQAADDMAQARESHGLLLACDGAHSCPSVCEKEQTSSLSPSFMVRQPHQKCIMQSTCHLQYTNNINGDFQEHVKVEHVL